MSEQGHWYVLGTKGEPEGPLTIDALKDQIRAGKIKPGAKVNRAGTEEWIQVESVVGHPQAPPPSSTDPKPNWAPVAVVVLLAALACEVGGGLYLLHHHGEREHADASALLSLLEEEAKSMRAQRVEDAGTLVNLSAVLNDCYANNSVAECHVTNTLGRPITVCMVGTIAQKESSGVQLKSMPMCTGPIRPLETKAVSAPWDGGRPVDMCNNVRGFLDWEKCSFNVANYEPRR